MNKHLLAFLLGLAVLPVSAQEASRVKDLNEVAGENPSSNPEPSVVIDGVAYFAATDRYHGTELWKSDGTESGTVRVKDIRPGANDSDPQNLTAVGNVLFFTAEDAFAGRELWKSDGTEAGTVRVKDIRPGTDNALDSTSDFNDRSLAAYEGKLYFAATDAAGDKEMWVSDGTADGTVPLKNIRSDGSSEPQQLTVANDLLFFTAVGSSNDGRELWKSDGTEGGTVLVKNVFATTGQSSNPSLLTAAGVKLYFVATDGNGSESDLWVSDGTESGTVLVKDIGGSSVTVPQQLTYVAGLDRLFFTAAASGGRELWVSDGTEVGTQEVKDIHAGTDSSSPKNLYAFGNLLLFRADGGTNGSELWKSNGTGGGTEMVKNISSGSGSSTPGTSAEMIQLGNLVYFNVVDQGDSTLWKTDGTGANTMPVGDLDNDVRRLAVLGNELIYSSDSTVEEDVGLGFELWAGDGTDNRLVKDINPATSDGVSGSLLAFGGSLFFGETSGTDTPFRGLSTSDGTALGTEQIKNLLVEIMGTPGGGPSNPLVLNDAFYFLTSTSDPGVNEVWTSDGSEDGTVAMADSAGAAGPLTQAGDRFYFTKSSGADLWTSDGTATALVKSIGAEIKYRTAVGDTLFFSADDGSTGRELWKSDGTNAGTVMVKNLNNDSSEPSGLAGLGDEILFFAQDNVEIALWKSDGSDDGTVKLKALDVSLDSSLKIVVAGENAYFVAYDATNGEELWTSDGTAEGTVLVADLTPGDGGSDPDFLTAWGDRLLFSVRNSEDETFDLYITDGTESGTKRLEGFRHIEAIYADAEALAFAVVADGGDGAGVELWASDGDKRTERVQDIAAGPDGSFPNELVIAGQQLFFIADDGDSGRELWVIDVAQLLPAVSSGSGGSSSSGGALEMWSLLGLMLMARLRRRNPIV